MPQPYKYFAFISYSRKDSKVAAWLQKRLEWFRFPVKFVPADRRPPDPRYIQPIYRDKTSLPVAEGHYWKHIKQALQQSRFLIVICSPNSAGSKPVNKEVRRFLVTHNRDASLIAPMILSGRPTSAGEDAALCPALRSPRFSSLIHRNFCSLVPDGDEKERDAWEAGFVALVSYLLKVDPAEIGDHIQRESKRQAKVRRRWLATVLVLAITSFVGVLIAYQQNQEASRQLERSQVEEGKSWLEGAQAKMNKGDRPRGLLLAGRAVGFAGYGRLPDETRTFDMAHPLLLGRAMADPVTEKERVEELKKAEQFIGRPHTTLLPLWASFMKKSVGGVVFSPNGSCFASSSWDETIKLWDAATGKELASLRGHKGSVTSVAFSPDGSRLASSSWDNTIKLWDAATGKELASIQDADWVTSVAFSSDGSRLASGSKDNTIKFWDAVTGKELASLRGHKRSVTSVAFSPDGSRLASGSEDNTIKLWSTVTGEELNSLLGHTKSVTSVAFSRDGSRLASGSEDHTIKLWDAATVKELANLQGHTDGVWSVAFSPIGNRLVSGSWDRTIRLWDTSIGKELACLQGHTELVMSVACSPDGSHLASGSMDNMIRLWDTASGKELASLQGRKNWLKCVAFCHDGSRLAVGSEDKAIKLWDAVTGKELTTLQGHTKSVTSVAFSPDGSHLASGSADNTIKLWDAVTGKELASLQRHTNTVLSVAFSPDGRRLGSRSFDDTIKLWDVVTGKELTSINGRGGYTTRFAFSPASDCLASRSVDLLGPGGNMIKLWDAATGKELTSATPENLAAANQWLAEREYRLHLEGQRIAEIDDYTIRIVPSSPTLDLTAPLRAGLAAFKGREVVFPEVAQTTPMIHYRQDTLAQLADPKLIPGRRAELRMELCTKSSQFRAATALWQRLLQGEWPGFEGATVPKDQAPATIPANGPIRRLYLLALIDATKHPQIHGHPTICQTAAQIALVLTKEMMAAPTISLAMMSLMQTLAKDDNPDMSAPRSGLLKRLEELASKEWLEVLQQSTQAK